MHRSTGLGLRSLQGALVGALTVTALLPASVASAQEAYRVPDGFTRPGAAPVIAPAYPAASAPTSVAPAPTTYPRPAPSMNGYARPAPSMMGYVQPSPQPATDPVAMPPSPTWEQPLFTAQPYAMPRPVDRDAPTPAPASSDDGPAFDLAVVSQLPLMIGAQVGVELPYRFLLQGELGVLPPAYVNALDSALVATGTYDSTTSTLVRDGLKNSMVARISAGIRPFSKHGFEMLGGYTVATFGGGVSARDAVAAVAGMTLPDGVPDGEVAVKTTIHNVHASLGWRWVVADHLVIRTSIAYMQTIGSSSHVEVPAAIAALPAVAARLPQVNQALDTKLNDTYTTYGKLPLFGLSLGYRF